MGAKRGGGKAEGARPWGRNGRPARVKKARMAACRVRVARYASGDSLGFAGVFLRYVAAILFCNR